jgi:hypothetical protein
VLLFHVSFVCVCVGCCQPLVREYACITKVQTGHSHAKLNTYHVHSLTHTYTHSFFAHQLVLCLTDVDSQEVLERWSFDVQCDKKQIKDGKAGMNSVCVCMIS